MEFRLLLRWLSLTVPLTACTSERPRAGQETTVDTMMVFVAEGTGTYPRIADSSRLLVNGSFRSDPTSPPCRLVLDTREWASFRVPVAPNGVGFWTVRLPQTFKDRTSKARTSLGSQWVVWEEDSTVPTRGHFRLSFREKPQGYPHLTIGGTRGQTQVEECRIPTQDGPISVALFTIAWLDGRADRPYVVAYWEPRRGPPVQVFATGIGPDVQRQFVAALRTLQYSRP